MPFRDLTDLKRYYKGQAGELVKEFFVPVLSAAVRYDRQTGYFDSASLVQMAAGLTTFVQRYKVRAHPATPPIRLVTGATWAAEDVQAYRRGMDALHESLSGSMKGLFEPTPEQCRRLGLPEGWRPEADPIARNRYGVLAWLVATGLLEVKVALPLDHAGQPLPPGVGGALFHPKVGILTDEWGDRVAFQGSVNETSAAWTRNREAFDVRRSWDNELDEQDIQEYERDFAEIWAGRDPGLLVLPLPQGVLDRLQEFIPPDGPVELDPMVQEDTVALVDEDVRAQALWFLEAPCRRGGERLVLEPLWTDSRPMTPYPHQQRVYERAVRQFPQSYLFCDEVGLGKTIEAGLAVRALILLGKVRRGLILAPRNLIRQWMEELREKFALTLWFYDGQVLTDVGGRVRHTQNPWNEDGLIIASRHLAVRQDRRQDVLGVDRPWDLVIVDEAHAARRRVFGSADEPNLALTLLQELRRQRLYQAMWLLTATPMQLATHEVHDLLLLCGLDDPSWQDWRSLRGFEEFFFNLREFPTRKDPRPRVFEMTRLSVRKGADDLKEESLPQRWTAFEWRTFLGQVRNNFGLPLALNQLNAEKAEALAPYLSKQTPLAVHMHRHTRATLRAYQERGLVSGLARREPVDVPVDFATDEERALYHRIDELCSQFYRMADLEPEERAGVGFLMAVFRKRLASSFCAFRKSLERRRDLVASIQGALSQDQLRRSLERSLVDEDDEEDEEMDELKQAVDAERQRLLRIYNSPERRRALDEERLYLRDYITKLAAVETDSKFAAFEQTLERLLREGHRIIVFTQYLDTLDFIRERLQAGFAGLMACYSGRGGEVWDPVANDWCIVDKAEVKARARDGHPQALRILLGTDAASEGLNLQSFSALINYDLPWNPMRVEQRIGRIDRIGQRASVVRIVNLYMQGTIEEETYLTLQQRIGLFHEVVGPLQPILAQMPAIFRRLARGEIELTEARRLLDEAQQQRPDTPITSLEGLVKDDLAANGGHPEAAEASATQEQLATWCLAHPAPGMRIRIVPEPGSDHASVTGAKGCLAITWAYAPPQLAVGPAEEILATFSGELADRNPPTAAVSEDVGSSPCSREGVRLLTWGDPYLAAWLGVLAGLQD